MKRVIFGGILAASVVAGCVYWHTNRNVYSLSIYAGGLVCGPSWHVGTSPNWIGFSQYTEVGFPGELGKKRNTPTYTEIDVASHRFKIKASARLIGFVGACLLVLVTGLAAGARDGFKREPTGSEA